MSTPTAGPAPAKSAAPTPTPGPVAAGAGGPAAGAGAAAAGGNRCHTCQEEIKATQFIRVGEFKFHKDHFTCCMCNKNLHGQKFHPKDGKFFCADDYILKFCHTCGHCKLKILVGSVIQACGGYYHPDHFVCCVCEKPFKNGKYFESTGKPYCEEHYLALTAEKCETCRKPVDESSLVRISGKAHHSACLSCSHCGISLAIKGSIFQKESKVYCQEDYQNFFCKRCTACGLHLLQNCITVNDEFYHPTCLVCSVCQKALEKYTCVEGHLRCDAHTDFTTDRFDCCVCSLTIDPPTPIRCCGLKCHEACFSCQFCATPLTKSTCTLKEGKLCCQGCVMLKTTTSAKSPPAAARAVGAAEPSPAHSRRPSAGPAAGPVDASGASTPSSAGRELKTPAGSPPAASAGGAARGSATSPSGESPSEERKTAAAAAGAGATPPTPPTKRSELKKMPAPKERIEYKKGELIGKGSFGKVYMGMNAATGELIAIKQVMIKSASDMDTAKEIENEISLMHNLRHPHIVTLLETQRVGNKLNILMEYVPGKSMDTMLERFGAFSEKVTQSYTRQLLEALEYCHRSGVVHRDIKGKNVLIDTRGNLKLADFGSAKRFDNVLGNAAPSVGYNYTPLWTAPEVLVGDYNSKVDIWSLGCVIIEMASGKPPWSEENFENPFRALYHIGNSNAIPKIPDSLSPLGRQFVLSCLERDPKLRPSATECLAHSWLKKADEVVSPPGADDEDD